MLSTAAEFLESFRPVRVGHIMCMTQEKKKKSICWLILCKIFRQDTKCTGVNNKINNYGYCLVAGS